MAKGRPSNNPVIVHVADIETAQSLTLTWPGSAQVLSQRFWPGPLTLVLPRSKRVPEAVTGGGPTVAIRFPSHPVAIALIRAANVPIAAPSANRSSELSPTRAEHVLRGLDGRIDVLLDGGPTSAGIESTVIDLSTTPPRLLRPGPVSSAEIEALLGPIDQRVFEKSPHDSPLPSPGLLARHYAPDTPLECIATLEGLRERAGQLLAKGESIAIVSSSQTGLTGNLKAVVLSTEPKPFATDIYRVLHDLDRANLTRILILLPPESDEWLAVRDRLLRAAAPIETTREN